MSRLGKILVVVNLGLSVVFAAGAAMLYLNRTDLSATKGKDGTPDGALVAPMAEYEELSKTGIHPADARLRAARELLESHEAWRPYERAWYAKQLQTLRTGATEAAPAQQLVRGPDGSVSLDPDVQKSGNVLKMEPVAAKDRDGNPLKLKAGSFYDDRIPKVIKDVYKAVLDLKHEAERDTAATAKLKGPKGLQARLEAEQAKRDAVIEEYKLLRPKWLNAAVELKELEELRQRLDERVKELTTTKVTQGP